MRKLLLIIALAMAYQAVAVQQNSIFSEGEWYRFSTDFSQPSKNAIKLTYEKLSNSGIDLQGVNPDKIKLLMMPPGLMDVEVNYDNSNPLKEIPVKLYGCEDGSFDEDDFLLFYPASQQQWNFDNEEGYFLGEFHPYSDKVNYFLRTDAEEDGFRIADIPFLDQEPEAMIQNTQVITGGPSPGGITPVNAGAEFVAQEITETGYSFEVGESGVTWPDATVVFRVVANNIEASQVRLLQNGNEIGIFELEFSDGQIFKQSTFSDEEISVATGDVFTVEWVGASAKSSTRIFLDDFSLQGETPIPANGLFFSASQPSEEVTEWSGPWDSETEIWNVTYHTSIVRQQMNTENVFRTQSDVTQKFVAFNPQTDEGIQAFDGDIGPVDYEDLYAVATPDIFVVTNQNLMEDAQSYASVHQNRGFSVEVVDIESVYHNFSGGVTDFTAIRNFMAYHYNKSDGSLSYLTIYGDASIYPDDDRFVVPAYQTTEVWNEYLLEAGDRYFAYLEDGENFMDSDADMDIAPGRIPVATREEAAMFNQKLLTYLQDQGEFQISMTLAADDEDNGVHMDIQEGTQGLINEQAKCMNVHKVYLDQYPQETQGDQQVSPDAQQAVVDAFARGDILIDYMGHAGHSAWAHEQMLSTELVNDLDNTSFPFVISTSRQDFFHPESASLSEQLLLQQHGAIACLSSAHVTFVQTWSDFKTVFYQAVFEEGIDTHGMAMKYAYNHTFGNSAGSYCLLGDPVMSFPFPEYEVLTDAVNGMDVELVDTLFVDEPYTLQASVYDDNGVVSGFEGEALVRIFAPVHQQTTLGTDQAPFSYLVSDSLLFEQEVLVSNGSFEATFSLPSSYNFSPGDIKISYYALGSNESAAGYEYLFSVSEPSGFDEGEDIRFKVYPTITDSDVVIEFERDKLHRSSYLEILDMQGNCLLRKSLSNNFASRINLSMSDYPSGMYLVRLAGQGYSKMVKIIRK